MGARHPTFIDGSLGMNESKHNADPATNVKYVEAPIQIFYINNSVCSYALKTGWWEDSAHILLRTSGAKSRPSLDPTCFQMGQVFLGQQAWLPHAQQGGA